MISVFMYHDIRDDKKYPKRYDLKSFLNVNKFKNHLDFIVGNYDVIKTSDIPNVVNEKDNYAVLTFDDGLKDHYNITELLLSHNINGTFLIPTLPITEGKMIHSHKIQYLLALEDEKTLTKKILENTENPNDLYNHYSKTNVSDNWWSQDMVFTTNFLRNHGDGVGITNRLFNEIVTNDEKEFCDDLYLTEKNIIEMVSNGMDIGGHGYTSIALTDNNQRKEIDGSIDFISKFYDGDVMFSYPNGIYNDETVDILEQRGCKYH